MQEETRSITVSQLNNYVSRLLKANSNLQAVRIAGELSDVNVYRSGHFYFSLKDENAKVSGIMYKSQFNKLGFIPKNGDAVIIIANATLYERGGSFQIQALNIEPQGKGNLYALFEKLNKKLKDEGLYNQEHKKPIPKMPKVIGVATSKSGAVIRDIINVSKRRFPGTKILLSPCSVQGPGSSESIVKSIHQLNQVPEVDLIIVGRGGGSLEDLWSFNEENVARAVFASEKPIISAVGHESDTTICDFVADLRAPTPSAAAELALPNQDDIINFLNQRNSQLRRYLGNKVNMQDMKLSNLSLQLKQEIANKLSFNRHRLSIIANNNYLQNPYEAIERRSQAVDYISNKIAQVIEGKLAVLSRNLAYNTASLDALSPLKVLSRGYAMVTGEGEELPIISVDDIDVDDKLNLYMQDGSLTVGVIKKEKN